MILYKSTRGDKNIYSFSEAILKGIADDGGLLVPDRIPRLTLVLLKTLLYKSYQERALYILNLFETDISPEILRDIVYQAYSTNFDHPKIAPLIKLKDNQYILELWHGPTNAFKDMALQIMPLIFAEALKKDNAARLKRRETSLRYLILVATSGDTGKAALEGYRDKEGLSILVFYPKDGVSRIQKLSMATQKGDNVGVFATKGDFDAIQKRVKETFSDVPFNKNLLGEHHVVLSSANSINWGRLLPQIIYHVSGYLDLLDQGVIKNRDEIYIAVPTGNFGNLLAAYYAKKMGLPIRKLICASNQNNILTEFLQSGVYDVRNRVLVKTFSPSMDIIIASNIERLLYEITQEPQLVSVWMKQLQMEKRFEVDEQTREMLRQTFFADWVSNDDCLKTIKREFDETGYLMDPHTAVAQTVVERYSLQHGKYAPIVVCSTAHFAKFAGDVYCALSGEASKGENEFDLLDKIAEKVPGEVLPTRLTELRNKPLIHTGTCEAGQIEIEKVIYQYLDKRN